MKSKELLRVFGDVDDEYIDEAAPRMHILSHRLALSKKRSYMHVAATAACVAVALFATTFFAAAYIQSGISSFYLRYLRTEDMAVADSLAEQYGAKIYFDGLRSNDRLQQYFAINKLVEYYNDETVRQEAIGAITPFLADEEEMLADAAVFALSVLTQVFDDPRILRLADGSFVFTLFNEYSDYGSYNRLWRVQDGELAECLQFSAPHMYIGQMVLSPDAKLLAIKTVSNKSEYIIMYDVINGYVSKELVDSARILVAKDMGHAIQQRMDFENYSSGMNMVWIDDDTLAFEAGLRGEVEGLDEFEAKAVVQYHFEQGHMDYRLVTD